MPPIDSHRANARIIILAAVIAAAIWLWALWPSEHELIVTFINVGQGDSILIETPRKHVILVDAGPPGAEAGLDAGSRIVAPLLRAEGIKVIDLLILTHPHDDHAGGMLSILRQFRVRRLTTPNIAYSSPTYKDILRTVKKRRIPLVNAHQGLEVHFPDGVTLSFLHPSASDLRHEPTERELNDLSAVAKLEFGKAKFLLAADAGGEAEIRMLARGMDLRADVLKVGHHGSSTATTGPFLREVSPRIAVVSVGRWNEFGHPAKETLARLRRSRIRAYRTDLDGTVTIETDGERIWVRQSRKPFWLRGSD